MICSGRRLMSRNTLRRVLTISSSVAKYRLCVPVTLVCRQMHSAAFMSGEYGGRLDACHHLS